MGKKFRCYEKKLKYGENKIEILQIQILNRLQDVGRNSLNLFGDPNKTLRDPHVGPDPVFGE